MSIGYKAAKKTAVIFVSDGSVKAGPSGDYGVWDRITTSTLERNPEDGSTLLDNMFRATLEGKNGVAKKKYFFLPVSTTETSGTYSDIMVDECNKFQMKPVCDHPSYCKNDEKALYIGQSHHLAYKPHRKNSGYMPGGFSQIENKWDGMCAYTNRKGQKDNALCNIPSNSHGWFAVASAQRFMCGSTKEPVAPSEAAAAVEFGKSFGFSRLRIYTEKSEEEKAEGAEEKAEDGKKVAITDILEKFTDSPGTSGGWSDNKVIDSADGKAHGLYGKGEVAQKSFAPLKPHKLLRVRVRYWAIDSWDGNEAGVMKAI